MRSATLLSLLLLAACSSAPSENDAGGSDATDAGADVCLGADASACAAMNCVALNGWRSAGAPSVISGGGEYAGCATPSGSLCGLAFTCAIAPGDGACWTFKDTCLPDGWANTTCDGDSPHFCPTLH